ncbi:hypothetical protein E5288_WYG014608 [Bos mutus]|uniref:NAD-dependent epimerase/dehydratase domain-containing protein n=1 Tax=Bos mutus TaxID=72004 RepID=A0A6B0R2P8_9CETA|nr:hypothetical protein [Bos mutus]
MCYACMKQEGVAVRVARIFNTFGPRMHMNDGRVVSNFILQALQGEPLTVYRSGSQTRAFRYVSDLVNRLVALTNSNVSSPVKLGNPEEHTILEFAQLIKNPVGSGSKIQFLSEAQDDPPEKETRHQESEADAGVGANGPAGGRVKQSHLLLPERTRVPCK